jgi:hypothetical protein
VLWGAATCRRSSSYLVWLYKRWCVRWGRVPVPMVVCVESPPDRPPHPATRSPHGPSNTNDTTLDRPRSFRDARSVRDHDHGHDRRALSSRIARSGDSLGSEVDDQRRAGSRGHEGGPRYRLAQPGRSRFARAGWLHGDRPRRSRARGLPPLRTEWRRCRCRSGGPVSCERGTRLLAPTIVRVVQHRNARADDWSECHLVPIRSRCSRIEGPERLLGSRD